MKMHKILLSLTLAMAPLMAATPALADPQKPAITQPVDDSVRVPLRGNIQFSDNSSNDLGVIDDAAPTGTLYLLLGRTAIEQLQMDQYILSLSTQGSGQYRHWLTPTEFGEKFGADDQDISTITAWLQNQGFKVEKLLPSKTLIGFSGTAGQVRTAFGTEIHKFQRNSTYIIANNSDPQIPAAMAPVVRGVVGLSRVIGNAEGAKSTAAPVRTLKAITTAQPDLTSNNSNGIIFTLAAGDAAVVYDVPNTALNPIYSGTSYDGTGVTIGALELSNLSPTNLQDILNYRTNFLNNTAAQAAAYTPTVVVEGTDPGVCASGCGGDSFDADNDSPAQHAIADGEISQAIAPGSKTILYVAQTVQLALQGAVDANNVSILINGIDQCENQLGAANNAFLDAEYEQAAAEGITVVASTGDWGSTGCEATSVTTTTGYGVSGTASTPWNVAVGGTDFQTLYSSTSSFAKYVNIGSVGQNPVGTAPYYTTALSYIPEGAWNDTTNVWTEYPANVKAEDWFANASGGGASSQAVCSGTVSSSSGTCSGSLSGYPKPSYQTSLTPSDGVRDLPDISIFSGGGSHTSVGSSFWATCQDASVNGLETDCTGSNNGYVTAYNGVSASTAAAAGIFALVEQKNGERLGLPNPTLYRLFTVVPTVFHDITTSNNSVPCAAGSTNCGSNGFIEGFNAGIGYDQATGLGSLDVAKLVSNWASSGLEATTSKLEAGISASSLGTASFSVIHGSTVYFAVSVNPSSATGNISILDSSGALASVALASGSASFSSQSLPGGSYNIFANYEGDSNDQASTSNSISVTVSPETTTLGTVVQSIDPSSGSVTNNASSVAYGTIIGVSVTPYGSAGEGKGTTPTGTVTDTLGAGTSTVVQSQTVAAAGASDITFNNVASITPGSDSVNVSYSGDNSYKSATAKLGISVTQATVSVVPGVPGASGCTILKSDWSVKPTCTAGVDVITDSVGSAPSGSVSISFNGTTQNVVLAPGGGHGTSSGTNVVDGVAQTSAIDVTNYVGTYLPTGTANYAGDSNYKGGSGTSTTVQANEWVVVEPSGASFALSNSGAITVVSPGETGTSTVTITPASGFIGQVALTCSVSGGNGTDEPTCTVSSSATVTGNSAVAATLSVATTASSSASVNSRETQFSGSNSLLTAIGFLLFGGLLWRRRSASAFFIVVLTSAAITISGCGGSTSSGGGGGGGNSGTPAGTYTVTIKASNPNVTYNNGWVSNPIISTTTVTLNVN